MSIFPEYFPSEYSSLSITTPEYTDLTYLSTPPFPSVPLGIPSLSRDVGHPLLRVWNLNKTIILVRVPHMIIPFWILPMIIPVRTPSVVIPFRVLFEVIPGIPIILVILHEFELFSQGRICEVNTQSLSLSPCCIQAELSPTTVLA